MTPGHLSLSPHKPVGVIDHCSSWVSRDLRPQSQPHRRSGFSDIGRSHFEHTPSRAQRRVSAGSRLGPQKSRIDGNFVRRPTFRSSLSDAAYYWATVRARLHTAVSRTFQVAASSPQNSQRVEFRLRSATSPDAVDRSDDSDVAASTIHRGRPRLRRLRLPAPSSGLVVVRWFCDDDVEW